MLVKKKLKADLILAYDNEEYKDDADAEVMVVLGVEQFINSLGVVNVLSMNKKGTDVGVRLHIKEDGDRWS